MKERHTVPKSDVCLLLRAHAERGWLSREVMPALQQLESPATLPAEQLPAALAYLEVAWMKAQLLAWESDSARSQVQRDRANDTPLGSRACRYHTGVRDARDTIAHRVATLLAHARHELQPIDPHAPQARRPIARFSPAHRA